MSTNRDTNNFRQSKLLRIKSSDKNVSTDGNTNFKVSFNNSLALHNISAISIKSISFLNLAYNIPTAMTIEFNAGAGNVAIPAGQYTMAELLVLVKAGAEVVLGGPTLTYTYDGATKKISWILSSGTITIDTDANSKKYLGITTDLVLTTTIAYSQDFGDLSGEKSLFLHSNTLSDAKYISNSSGSQQIIAEVPIIAEFGFLNLYESNASDTIDTISYAHKRTIQTIDLSLRDEDNNVIDLGTQAELFCVIKVFYN